MKRVFEEISDGNGSRKRYKLDPEQFGSYVVDEILDSKDTIISDGIEIALNMITPVRDRYDEVRKLVQTNYERRAEESYNDRIDRDDFYYEMEYASDTDEIYQIKIISDLEKSQTDYLDSTNIDIAPVGQLDQAKSMHPDIFYEFNRTLRQYVDKEVDSDESDSDEEDEKDLEFEKDVVIMSRLQFESKHLKDLHDANFINNLDLINSSISPFLKLLEGLMCSTCSEGEQESEGTALTLISRELYADYLRLLQIMIDALSPYQSDKYNNRVKNQFFLSIPRLVLSTLEEGCDEPYLSQSMMDGLEEVYDSDYTSTDDSEDEIELADDDNRSSPEPYCTNYLVDEYVVENHNVVSLNKNIIDDCLFHEESKNPLLSQDSHILDIHVESYIQEEDVLFDRDNYESDSESTSHVIPEDQHCTLHRDLRRLLYRGVVRTYSHSNGIYPEALAELRQYIHGVIGHVIKLKQDVEGDERSLITSSDIQEAVLKYKNKKLYYWPNTHIEDEASDDIEGNDLYDFSHDDEFKDDVTDKDYSDDHQVHDGLLDVVIKCNPVGSIEDDCTFVTEYNFGSFALNESIPDRFKFSTFDFLLVDGVVFAVLKCVLTTRCPKLLQHISVTKTLETFNTILFEKEVGAASFKLFLTSIYDNKLLVVDDAIKQQYQYLMRTFCPTTSPLSSCINVESDYDTVVKCSDGEVKAHRALLSKSEFFSTMFNSGLRETHEQDIDMSGMFTSRSFMVVCRYLYGDRHHIEFSDAMDIVTKSDYLMLSQLRSLCQLVLLSDMNNENCSQLLLFCYEHSLYDLFLCLEANMLSLIRQGEELHVTDSELKYFEALSEPLSINNVVEKLNSAEQSLTQDVDSKIKNRIQSYWIPQYECFLIRNLRDLEESKRNQLPSDLLTKIIDYNNKWFMDGGDSFTFDSF
ncbi:hypothetical protein AKO1_014973 [Acrasis kona]|uniref:BTB domain-containing protein n=1 Tax=Acrasis kona TaxID=1008807 RepID=A0AAW2Z1W7_9EUKA